MEQVRPRWLGHDLSGAPDSGNGCTQDGKTRSGRVSRFGQSTFQPTIPQLIRCKCRAGVRVVTVSDTGLDVRSEGAMWGMPHKRVLFGPEAYRRLVMLRRSSRGGRQTTRTRKRPSRGGRQIASIRYPCMRERLVGTNIGKCLRLLFV